MYTRHKAVWAPLADAEAHLAVAQACEALQVDAHARWAEAEGLDAFKRALGGSAAQHRCQAQSEGQLHGTASCVAASHLSAGGSAHMPLQRRAHVGVLRLSTDAEFCSLVMCSDGAALLKMLLKMRKPAVFKRYYSRLPSAVTAEPRLRVATMCAAVLASATACERYLHWPGPGTGLTSTQA